MSQQNDSLNRENQVSYLTLHEYVKKARQKDYGFRSLVHEIVQSKLFQTK